jgi:hypothetical protein
MNLQPLSPRFALAVAALTLPLAARADVLNISDSKDAMIFGKKPTTPNPTADQYTDTGNAAGAGPAIFAGADGSSNIKRALIQFDLSSIPTGSTITSATITLYLAQVAGSAGNGNTTANTTDREFGLYANLQPWTEGPSNRTTVPGVGGTGQGVPRGNGDVTWDYASYNTNPALAVLWNNGNSHGGDFSSTESGHLQVPLNATLAIGGAFTFPTSTGLVTDVQNWLDDPTSNDGWLFKSDNLELTPTSFLGFWTREAVSEGNDPSIAIAPTLTVTFTPPTGAVPEPASLGLIALAAPALLIRRRRHSRSTIV